MGFWETFVATLAGAVVGAFAAWLFSLDLRRRERDDRVSEREQTKADRQAERGLDRQSRDAEREEEREYRQAEREQQRREDYEAAIMREWPRVASELQGYAAACKAVAHGASTGPVSDVVDQWYRRSVGTLMGTLHEVATVARDSDHEIVNNLGVLMAVSLAEKPETADTIDGVRIQLSAYMTAQPEYRQDRKDRLRNTLAELTGVKPRP